MKNGPKGIALLVLALGVVTAFAISFLNDGDDSTRVGSARAESMEAAPPDPAVAAPASAAAAASPAAERAAESGSGAPGPAETTPRHPTADHLSGVVVDANGRPVAGAAVSFGPPEGLFFNRRAPRGGIVTSRSGAIPPPDPVRTRSGADGSFRMTQVPRVENLGLRVDHPDFVIYTRNDLIVPSGGMDLGRIALTAGGTVSGEVFGPDGAKLAGAEVSLRDPPDDEAPIRIFGFDFSGRGGRRATTDADGRFRLAGMPAGRALVAATAEGLCEATSPAVEVVALQEVGGIVLRLERGHTLSGIVRDGGGRPLAGAAVNAATGDAFRRMAAFVRGRPDAVTGDDGCFTLAGLEPGVYEVTASADGYAPKSVAGVDSAARAPLEITLGESARIAGTVRIKGSGELARAVQVQLVPYWGENVPAPALDAPDAKNEATADGAFLIADVDPGQYRVAARGEGTTRAFSAPITVEEGRSLENLEIEVERGAVLAGRVVDAATGAPIEDAEIACFTQVAAPSGPLDRIAATPGRRISVTSRIGGIGRLGFDPDRHNVGRTRTDAEGRFQVPHLSAGIYVIDAGHADYATARSEPIEVAAADTREAADVALGRGGAVEGIVVGIDGMPRASDRIDVESRSVPGVTRSAVADARGWYRIEHVPAGEAIARRIESDDPVRTPRMVFRAVVIDGQNEPQPGKRIVVEEGETLRVDFSQMEKPYVEGLVTCADGPVAGALVSAMPDQNNGMPMLFGAHKEATTGADGRFRLADLDPGSWRVSVRHPQGLVPTTASVLLEEGRPARQDYFLEGGVVEGTVTALAGRARLEGATVALDRVRAESGASTYMQSEVMIAFATGGRRGGAMQQLRFGNDPGARVSTDRDGRFRVPWVPAGKYRVSVTRPGYVETRSEEIEIAPNGHVDHVDVAMPSAATLLVHMRSKADGSILSGSPVQLEHESGESRFGTTDAEGIARFESLQPGAWTATGRRSWSDSDGRKSTVTCEAERVAEITIDV